MKSYYLFILITLLIGCEPPIDDSYASGKQNNLGAVFKYLNPADTGSSLLSTIVKDPSVHLDTFDPKVDYQKKYSWQKQKNMHGMKIITYHYEGLHLYDTSGMAPGYALKVIGAYGISILDSSRIAVQSSIGTAIIRLGPNNTFKAESFTFDYSGEPPPLHWHLNEEINRRNGYFGDKLFFNCPSSAIGIVYGWEVGLVTGPVCYK